ncbi:cytochrome P450 [Nonomuraea sp. NPDC004354]
MSHRFPVDRTCPFALPEAYSDMRAEAPVVSVDLPGGPIWLITRNEEGHTLLKDHRVSTSPTTPGHPYAKFSADPPLPEVIEAQSRDSAGEFVDLDPPEHTRFRQALVQEFSLRKVNELRPSIQRTVDRLIDAVEAQGTQADLVKAVALPLPALTLCQMLGVPSRNHDFLLSRIRATDNFPLVDPLAKVTAIVEMRDCIASLVQEASQSPGDDIVGRLLETGAFTREEVAGVAFFLLTAGHLTTSNMISLGVLTLLRHPGLLDELKGNPELWRPAVEELLRFHSITDWFTFDRVATEDISLGGQTIRAGDGIFVLGASVNHDERVFYHPGEFDIHRDTGRHLAFGHGIHTCLGANLARAEIEISLRTLFTRLPGLRITVEDDELALRTDGAPFGVYELPVAW